MSKRNSAQHYAAVIIATYYSVDFKQIPLFFLLQNVGPESAKTFISTFFRRRKLKLQINRGTDDKYNSGKVLFLLRTIIKL